MLKKIVATLILSSFTFSALAHSSHDEGILQDITIKTTKVTDKVYMLQGRGGNVGALVGADGILIIDDDYAEVSPKLAEALKSLGTDKPKFIFNTHWHADHTQGNNNFGKDSIIISHINVRNRLAVDTMIFGNKSLAYPKFALPMLTYEQSMTVHFDDEDVKAVHYPNGHTDGDSVIFFTKSNVVHMGDDFFLDRFPFIDLENGGSVQGYIKNIAEIIPQLASDVKIIPGHGNLGNLDDLKRFHQMIIDTSAIVEKGMKKKKTLEQLKKEGLPDKFKTWGSGFIKTDAWIETIYKSFSKK